MVSRTECDLHIPYKNLPQDIPRLARQLSQDMLSIERWAQRFRRECLPEPVTNCEAAGSLIGDSTQEFLTGSGATVVTLNNTIHLCGVTKVGNTLVVGTTGIYHLTASLEFAGFVGVGGAAPTQPSSLIISTSRNDSIAARVLGWHESINGYNEGTLHVSFDTYLVAGQSASLIFSNNSGGTSYAVSQLDVHLVHCDCVGALYAEPGCL